MEHGATCNNHATGSYQTPFPQEEEPPQKKRLRNVPTPRHSMRLSMDYDCLLVEIYQHSQQKLNQSVEVPFQAQAPERTHLALPVGWPHTDHIQDHLEK